MFHTEGKDNRLDLLLNKLSEDYRRLAATLLTLKQLLKLISAV